MTAHNRRPWLAVVAVTLLLLAVACSDSDETATDDANAGSTTEPAQEEARDRVERVRLASAPGSGYPSPFGWVRGPGKIFAGFIFDELLWEDSTGEPIPWLAEEWEGSEDGLEWRFTLREDAQWHDGEPVTADDVVFSVEYMTEGPGAGAAGFAAEGLSIVEEVVAESEREVVFTLNGPAAAFEEDVAMSFFVIPEHIWADVADPKQFRGPEATIGSGPYRLESADEASGSFLYTANDDFYLGAPVVERLEFVPAEDPLLAIQRGEIDAAETDLEEPVPDQQLAAFEENPQLGRVDAPGSWNRVLFFNLERGVPFDDVRFRQAIAYAIDREDLVERIMFGRGEVGSTGALAPNNSFLADDLPTYDHDPEQADELLDELGMVDADGDGFRELPDGAAFRPELLDSNRFSSQTPELIQEYLREVGIDISVNVLDQAAADEAAGQGNYDMALVGFGGIMGDPDSLRTRYSSASQAGGFTSVHGYSNADFDLLADEQQITVDTEERSAMVDEMQQIVAEDVPTLSLYVPDDTVFFDREVLENWYYTPGCSPCGGTRNKHLFVTGLETGFE